jgi:formyltetrahydrofolate synthetase
VIERAEKVEPQEHNRIRFWARVAALNDRYLRVITLADGMTIHNAFPDRGFKP